MRIKSLDPRIERAALDTENKKGEIEEHGCGQTYEVFHQQKRGTHHQHVGSVHATNPELAMIFAKEQYARRGVTVNLWVVKSSEVYASAYEDQDIFELTPEKIHRDPESYKVMDKIKAYKERQAK